MTSRFIPFGTLLLAVTALSACNPAAGTAEGGKAAPAADAPSAAAASASGLPSCDEVGRLDPAVGASVTTTCEIALSGVDAGSSFKVELISGNVTEAGMPGEDAMVRVTRMVGAEPGQVIEEAGVMALVAPTYQDVDGDGEGDLLIVRDVGNVNAVQGVWLGSPDGAPYRRVGEVSGDFGDLTSDGYMTVSSRSSAATQCVNFYSIADQQLSLQASACITAEDEAGTKTTCVLEEVDALNPLEVNEENRAKFCAEPIVANAFK